MERIFFCRCVVLAAGISACGGNGQRSADHQLDVGRDSSIPASGGATGSGGANDSGGAPGSGGAADSGGVLGSGGLAPGKDGGAGAGGGTAPVAKARVLLIGPTDQLRACDADGETVADYRFALDFGPSYGRQTIWLGEWVRWNDQLSPGPYPLNLRYPGASRILIEAYPSAEPVDAQLDAQLKVLTIDGKVEASYPIPQNNTQLVLSPRGDYLYVASDIGKPADPSYCQECDAVILRSKDGSAVGQGFVTSGIAYAWDAAFSLDDRYFLYVTSKCEEGLHMLNLSDGQTAIVPRASLACPKHLATDAHSSVGFLNGGVIVFNNADPASPAGGLGLWFVDWQGGATPFASAAPPSTTYDTLLQVHPDGRRALWSRTSNGVAETFEFDLSSRQSQPFADAYLECYGQPAATRYEIQGQSVLACPCGGGGCAPFATLPTLAEPYSPTLMPSPDRRFVAVGYAWYLDRSPWTEAQALLYDARGKLVLTLPNGAISFDRTSALAMDCYSVGSGSRASECALVNLATAGVTTLSQVSFGFLYE
jgi:hypothetical protein